MAGGGRSGEAHPRMGTAGDNAIIFVGLDAGPLDEAISDELRTSAIIALLTVIQFRVSGDKDENMRKKLERTERKLRKGGTR